MGAEEMRGLRDLSVSAGPCSWDILPSSPAGLPPPLPSVLEPVHLLASTMAPFHHIYLLTCMRYAKGLGCVRFSSTDLTP